MQEIAFIPIKDVETSIKRIQTRSIDSRFLHKSVWRVGEARIGVKVFVT